MKCKDETFIYVPDLNHVFLHARGLAAAEDGEQLVVGDEEESREGVPLGVQVVVETLLALLQAGADHLQVLETVGGVAPILDLGVGHGVVHDLNDDKRKLEESAFYSYCNMRSF